MLDIFSGIEIFQQMKKDTARDKRERIVFLEKTGKWTSVYVGTSHEIAEDALPASVLDALIDGGICGYVHTHPSDDSFSPEDIVNILWTGQVFGGCVTSSGDLHILYRTNETPPKLAPFHGIAARLLRLKMHAIMHQAHCMIGARTVSKSAVLHAVKEIAQLCSLVFMETTI